jgi:hypothetical protein
LKLEDALKVMAKENQRVSGGAVPQKSAKPVETRKEIAKIAGVKSCFSNLRNSFIGKIRKSYVGNSTKDFCSKMSKSTGMI